MSTGEERRSLEMLLLLSRVVVRRKVTEPKGNYFLSTESNLIRAFFVLEPPVANEVTIEKSGLALKETRGEEKKGEKASLETQILQNEPAVLAPNETSPKAPIQIINSVRLEQ
jgi:hypothetical protein